MTFFSIVPGLIKREFEKEDGILLIFCIKMWYKSAVMIGLFSITIRFALQSIWEIAPDGSVFKCIIEGVNKLVWSEDNLKIHWEYII